MKSILLFLVLSLSLALQAQQGEWAEAFNTVGQTSIKVDKNGNTFALISYTDSIGEKNPVLTYDNLPRYTIIKRDKDNNFLWSKDISCTGRSRLSITFNQLEEAILNGYFSDKFITPDFQLISNGLADIFIIKISSDGTFLLIKQLGGPGEERGECVFDSKGSMIITGGYKYSANFDTITYQGNISEDFFLLSYDSSGKIKWSDRAVTADSSIYSYCNGSELKTDSFNNVYVEISGNAVLESNGISVGMYYGAYLYKFTRSGSLRKQYEIGSCYPSCFPAGYDIDNRGNIYYATARESAHTSFISSVVKKDSMDNVLWHKDYGLGGYDSPEYWIKGFYINQKGNYYTSGVSDTAVGIKEFIADGDMQTGNIEWTCHEKVDGSYITQDKEGSLYIAGTFRGQKTVGNVTIISMDSVNYFSPYVVKLSHYPTNQITRIAHVNTLNIFPNPSEGRFHILNETSLKDYKIKIYNNLGVPLYYKMQVNEIDLSAQPKGIYFVEILADGKRIVKKIILE